MLSKAAECYNCPAGPSRDNCNIHALSCSRIDIKQSAQVLFKYPAYQQGRQRQRLIVTIVLPARRGAIVTFMPYPPGR